MACVLIVDDQDNQRRIMAEILSAEGHTTLEAANVDEALHQITLGSPNVVLTDLKMPGKSGLALVEVAVKLPMPPEIIVITAFGTIYSAIRAIRLGAYDYLTKPIKPEELLFLIQRAYEKFLLRKEGCEIRLQLLRELTSNLVAESLAMQNVLDVAAKVAITNSTVLIRGETGTGKECIARLIHYKSDRKDKPLKSINCAAFSQTILDSELFGYEKGAFTGAVSRKEGIIESASGGTLFLDEIGDMSSDTQAKVLRVLQEKKIRRVGGTEDIPVDVRIVAATNKDLESAITKGDFREDLYYRLNVIPVVLPPLRERKADIPVLIARFLLKTSRPIKFDPETERLMQEYDWPGNVRELESVIERISILSDKDVILPDNLPLEIRQKPAPMIEIPVDLPDSGIIFEEWERALLSKALQKSNGNMVAAAKLLGMSYRAYRYRANTFGLKEP